MAIVRDAGDFSVKVGFHFGVEFPAWVAKGDQARIGQLLRDNEDTIKQKREKMELELLDFVCDQLGYTEDVVKQKVEARDAANEQAAIAEKNGRELRQRQREGRA